MKQNKTIGTIIASFLVITTISLVGITYTNAATTATTKTVTTTESKQKPSVTPVVNEETKEVVSERTTGIWNSIKNFGITIYNRVDTWRKGQQIAWQALKAEKQEEVKNRDVQMDQGLKDRENAVLEGEQASIVQGSVKDFDWHIFLLKIYIAALTVFVFIFTFTIVFYGVIVVLVFAILRRLYQRVHYGY